MWQSRPRISETALPSDWSHMGRRHLDIVARAPFAAVIDSSPRA
jgi:hypothetical protein